MTTGRRGFVATTDVNDGDVMAKMGKRQQLIRRFGFLPILAMSATLLGSWEAAGSTISAGLYNGGPVSLVYGMVLSISGTMTLALSLAEMASICPISGAQFSWAFIFAPPKWAPFFCWMQGWITVFAWMAVCTGLTFLMALQIQGCAILANPDYEFQRWHSTLIMWAILFVCYFPNIQGISWLPAVEAFAGVLHIACWFLLTVPMLVIAPKQPASFVFTKFINAGGWESDGIAWSIGLLSVTWCFVGFDGIIHMSEETRKSAIVIPKILIMTIFINGTLAFGFLLTLLFCLQDYEDALSTRTGFPIIAIFYQATGSLKAALAMESAIIIISFASAIACVASVSRLTWAFARDGGLPFAKYFSHIDSRHRVPIRCITLLTAVEFLLSIINIGSSTAMNAIISLSTWSLYLSYLLPIILLIMRRIRVLKCPEVEPAIPFGPFTLGKWGMAVNIFALVYGTYICIFLPFPAYIPVTAENFNWASPVLASVLFLALIDWFLRGRRTFRGPRREVAKREDNAVDLTVPVPVPVPVSASAISTPNERGLITAEQDGNHSGSNSKSGLFEPREI